MGSGRDFPSSFDGMHKSLIVKRLGLFLWGGDGIATVLFTPV